jgi:hypothetical protein
VMMSGLKKSALIASFGITIGPVLITAVWFVISNQRGAGFVHGWVDPPSLVRPRRRPMQFPPGDLLCAFRPGK